MQTNIYKIKNIVLSVTYLISINFVALSIAEIPNTGTPKFIEAFPSPSRPKLDIGTILKERNIHLFKSNEGIILYNSKEDKWQLYKSLEKYESHGKLLNIVSVNHFKWIIMEKGILKISANTKPQLYDFTTDIIISDGFSIYFLILEKTDSSEYYHAKYNKSVITKVVLKKLDTKTNEISEIFSKKDKKWGSLLSWSYYKNRFWLAFNDKSVTLSNTGELIDLSDYDIYPPRITHFQVFNSKFYLFANGAYTCKINDKNIPKVTKIVSSGHYKRFKSNSESNNSIFLIPEDAPWENMILKFTPRNAKFAPMKLFLHYKNPWNPDSILFFDDNLWLLSAKYKVIAKLNISDNTDNFYLYTEGPLENPKYFAEDEREIWLTSKTYGAFIFNKKTNKWKLLPLMWQYPGFKVSQITLNKDYVFITRDDYYGFPKQIFIVDRHTNLIETIKPEDLRNRFYANYKKLGRKYYWKELLFFLKLPLTGVSLEFSRSIIQKDKYSLFCGHTYNNPSDNYTTINHLNHLSNEVTTHKLPRIRKYFKSYVLPYSIIGDKNIVWGISRGRDSRGLFKYDLKNKKFHEYKDWFEKIKGASGIGENDDKVFIGLLEQKTKKSVAILDKKSDKVELIGEEVGMSSRPWTFHTNKNYDFFATENGLIYLDKKNNTWGKIFSNWTRIHLSDFNMYVETEGKYYKLVQESD
jgi:hypothetical protein